MSKFKIGDKVRILPDPPRFFDDPTLTDGMKNYLGKEVTITSYDAEDSTWCNIEEDGVRFFWDERWFEPIQKKTVTISFDPSDRAAAHKAVEEAIKDFYTPKDWTDEEISSAKNLMKDMLQEVFMSGGDVAFDDACQKDNLVCVVHPDCFSFDESCGRSAPHGKDIYNIWIGKCVALCKALHRPIPDFIHLKNT